MRAIVVHRLVYGGSITLLALAAIWGPAVNFPIAWKCVGTVLVVFGMWFWIRRQSRYTERIKNKNKVILLVFFSLLTFSLMCFGAIKYKYLSTSGPVPFDWFYFGLCPTISMLSFVLALKIPTILTKKD